MEFPYLLLLSLALGLSNHEKEALPSEKYLENDIDFSLAVVRESHHWIGSFDEGADSFKAPSRIATDIK